MQDNLFPERDFASIILEKNPLFIYEKRLQTEATMKKARIGLIGLGFMGSTHFRIYEAMENAEIVALADIDPVKRKGDISKVIGNIGNADNSQPLNMTGIRKRI